MRTLIGLVILAALVGGAFVINHYARSKAGQSLLHVARDVEIEVETSPPQQREIVRTVQAPGEVEAYGEVDIRSEVVAKILEMPVEEGDYVRQGELLCRLDDADFRARLMSREANVSKLRSMITQAEAELEKAQLDYEQEKRLVEMGGTSAEAFARVKTTVVGMQAMVDMRKHELREAEALLQSAKEDLEKTVIRAPISGVVAQRFAKAGEVVVTGTMNNPGTRIMVVSDLSKMQVRCRVDESDAPLVASEQPARIYLQSDTRKSIPGRVLRVGTKGVKPTGRDVVTFETLVLINAMDQRVKPGMNANVEIEVARRDQALTVPIQAVVYRKRSELPEALLKTYDEERAASATNGIAHSTAEYVRLLFTVNENKAQARIIDIGISDVTDVEVTKGLEPNEAVVVGPFRSLDQLKDGAVTKAPKKPPTPPAEAVAKATPESQPTTAPAGQVATSQPASQPAAAGTQES